MAVARGGSPLLQYNPQQEQRVGNPALVVVFLQRFTTCSHRKLAAVRLGHHCQPQNQVCNTHTIFECLATASWRRSPVACTIAFIALYSLLPHKELRFVVYSFPMLTLAAAHGANWLWHMPVAVLKPLSRLGLLGLIALSLVATSIFMTVSHRNYPGGEALAYLMNNCEPACGSASNLTSVHVCNLAAQSGVSRFGKMQPYMSVSKLEQWTAEVVPGSFHWLIAEPKDAVAYSSTHEKVHQIKAITGQNLVKQWPFLQLHLEPVLFVMKRANSA
eukprot:TRINITY_DN10522_c0_g1_i3.p2 TRINITY_DN10522_c0_g1~~TRINITY_DN10522_c0_g1_i3.p2  ORF type:complete len:274 (+),score=20.41 TRINITY_DN10522_c0_g1_i3:679-1500(+)